MQKMIRCVLIAFLLAVSFILAGCGSADYGYGVDYDSTSADRHRVKFDLRGGHINGYPGIKEFVVNNGQTIDPKEFPKNPGNGNAVFGGWFTERNGMGNIFTKSMRVYTSFTVFAYWITEE